MALTTAAARLDTDRQTTAKGRLPWRATGQRAWAIERGATAWGGTVDVWGEFPGYATRAGRLEGGKVAITPRYLLVDEGRPHGFGIPLRWVVGARVEAATVAGGDAAVRVAYDDGVLVRWFAIRPRGTGLLRRGGDGAAGAFAALTTAGVRRVVPVGEPTPDLTISWDEARRFEHENVIWSGQASVPTADGGASAAAVWLTTRSLIWNVDNGQGVSRLPWSLVRDLVSTRLEDRVGTPVVYVAFGHGEERHALPFRFDRHASGDRNQRERGAFLVGARSRGVPLGAAAALWQPWSPDGDVKVVVPPPAVLEVETKGVGPVAEPGEDDSTWPTMASWAAVAEGAGEGSVPGSLKHAGVATNGERVDRDTARERASAAAITAAIGQAIETGGGGSSVPEGRGWPEPLLAPELPRARAFEAASLSALMGVLRGIDGAAGDGHAWVAPPGRADALAELDTAVAAGLLVSAEAVARKARLLALADAGSRLRALVELRDAGHLSSADVAAKRAAILAPLSGAVFGATG